MVIWIYTQLFDTPTMDLQEALYGSIHAFQKITRVLFVILPYCLFAVRPVA